MTQRWPLYLSLSLLCGCPFWEASFGCNGTSSVPMSLGSAGSGAPSDPVPASPAGSSAPAPSAGSQSMQPEMPAEPVAGGASRPQVPSMPMTPPASGVAGAPAAGSVAMEPEPTPMAGAGGEAMAGASGSGEMPMMPAAGMPALEPGALQCPNEVCAPLPEPPPQAAGAGFMIELCCAEGGDCGTSLNGGACNRTADSFPDCPPLSAMGFTVPSCCTPMGQCGIDGSSFMRGCMALEDIAAMAGAFIEVPAPKACTPTTM